MAEPFLFRESTVAAATGRALLEEGREAELIRGTQLADISQTIKIKGSGEQYPAVVPVWSGSWGKG